MVFDRDRDRDWNLENGILVEKPERKVMRNREPGICFTVRCFEGAYKWKAISRCHSKLESPNGCSGKEETGGLSGFFILHPDYLQL
jgi:hypothetical protein